MLRGMKTGQGLDRVVRYTQRIGRIRLDKRQVRDIARQWTSIHHNDRHERQHVRHKSIDSRPDVKMLIRAVAKIF
jgi:hypothetical protein